MTKRQDKIPEKFIDIDGVIKEKNPSLYQLIPGFLIRYVSERIVRERVLNQIMVELKDLNNFEFCAAVCERFKVTVRSVGTENIPTEGGAIFAANHPLGGMDAMAIMESISHHRSDVKFLVNDLLMSIINLRGIFVGVNKFGATPRENIRRVDELFGSENAVFIFPAGLVSRMTQHRVIRDLDWKKTFISKAKRHKKPIVPVHISGRLSRKFYRVAKIRKFFGIQMNIEMLLLAQEMMKQRGKTITITYGKPIYPATMDKTRSDDEWAYEVKSNVYNLVK
ncbi:1-acyl-sn-glycerol-3-phosphate acyltransferase [Schleiferiaceae bacterium]|jgi:putative hemolysin|nr:1-acyl-sn-glycerol-3-phosphate acyltransferase [Schleiferiaceae bacterium]